jgi:iron complex transport system ATP-binding protein
MTTPAALAATELRVRLGDVEVLHGVTLQFAPACWTAVVGPNGAGKSTLLRALAGLLPWQGAVLLQGQPLAQLGARVRARRIAWLGQGEAGGDDLTVWDVAMLGRLPHRGWLAAPGPEDLQAVEIALRATQAWDWRGRALGQLSGGERQRVLLARALAVQADVLLMDEPLANLDPPHQADWLAVVRQLVRQGRTVVSVLHEVSIALQADALVVMDRGQVQHHGARADAATHAALEAVFERRMRIRALEGHWVALPVSPQETAR